MKLGDDIPAQYDLSKIRLLGTVGEPINPEAWIWYHTVIGKERCPIVDTWWQTETGGHHDFAGPGGLRRPSPVPAHGHCRASMSISSMNQVIP